MRIVLLIAWLATVPFWAGAQEVAAKDTLVGLVVNKKGKGIRNVPVSVKGRSEAVRTGSKGIFTIVGETLPDTVTLMLPSQRVFLIPVQGQNFLKIITSETAFTVAPGKDEIVNIGYGTVRKSRSTSGDFSISGAELLLTGERDLLRALAGKVPGLNLVYRDNGTVTLRLRGGTSLDGNDDPLYIVDGAVVDDLSYLNLHDLEKVDVLKDGSIYGTRGANGAIVVTTRN